MISQEFIRRSEEDWRPFMEKLEKTVRRKKRVRQAKKVVVGVAAAFLLLFLMVNREAPRKSYLSARIPLRNSPTVTVAGGYALEKEKGVWVVCSAEVPK